MDRLKDIYLSLYIYVAIFENVMTRIDRRYDTYKHAINKDDNIYAINKDGNIYKSKA